MSCTETERRAFQKDFWNGFWNQNTLLPRREGQRSPEIWLALSSQRGVRPYLMESIRTAEEKETWELGRGQNMRILANVTKKPALRIVRNRKPIKDFQRNSKHDYIWLRP